MNKVHILLASLLVFLIQSGAFAQGCEEPAETNGSDPNAPKIIGYIQPQYEFHFTEDKDASIPQENSNAFNFKRARIGITGKIPYDFSYYALLETSPFIGGENAYLLDAFISYRRFEWFNFSMGAFKQPFGLEVGTSCSGLHTIERALVSDKVVAPQRDIGFMVFGGSKEKKVTYKLALMNGTGNKVSENNSKKDIIGRAQFHPLEYLSIGASYRYGYPKTDSTVRQSVAADISFEYSNFRAQAEYIYDDGLADEKSSDGGCGGGSDITLGDYVHGYWAMAMYKFYFNLEPVIKYEHLNTGNVKDDAFTRITFGVNYFFNDKTRLQLNYLYNSEYNKYKTAEKPNDALVMQLQVKF